MLKWLKSPARLFDILNEASDLPRDNIHQYTPLAFPHIVSLYCTDQNLPEMGELILRWGRGTIQCIECTAESKSIVCGLALRKADGER